MGTLLILASVLGGAAYTGYQAYQAGGTGAAFGAVLSTVVTAALSFGVAGTAGAAVGSAGNLLTQVATNPLVQKTVFYAYAGLAIANTLDSSPSSGLSTAATIVGLASLSLSFASATSSALANGAQPRSVSQGGNYVTRRSSNPPPSEAVRQERGAAAVAAAREAAPPGTEVAYHDRYGYVGPGGRLGTAGSFAEYQALPYDGVAGNYTPPRQGFLGFGSTPGRIDIYAQATFEGTFRLDLPRGGSVFETFHGADFARFVGFHEAAHASGLRGYSGAELDANAFALERLGR